MSKSENSFAEFIGPVFGIIAIVGVFCTIGFVIQGTDFILYRYFAPKQEQVRRETFEQSHAFRQGAIQELQQMQLEYVRSSPETRSGLASLLLRRASDIPDESTLPPDLYSFIRCVRSAAPTYTNNCN